MYFCLLSPTQFPLSHPKQRIIGISDYQFTFTWAEYPDDGLDNQWAWETWIANNQLGNIINVVWDQYGQAHPVVLFDSFVQASRQAAQHNPVISHRVDVSGFGWCDGRLIQSHLAKKGALSVSPTKRH